MKKFYTAIILMFAVVISKAQSIPNASFEDWTSFGTYSDPTSWYSNNSVGASFSVFPCEQGTPGAVGASYVKLTNKNVFGNPAPGVIQSFPFSQLFPSGFAYALRPQNLTGKYQYLITGNDSAYIYVGLTKWNTATMTSDPIAVGLLYFTTGSATSWTNFNIPLSYYSGEYPDSAIFIITSGLKSLIENDYLYIDDLAFTGSVSGIEEIQEQLNIIISPNPFSHSATIEISNFQFSISNFHLLIYDVLGQEVHYQTLNSKLETLNLDLPSGIYFYKVRNEKENIANGKLVIQ